MADNDNKVFKRKRKKTFLKKLKQHGKKGKFGKGVEISEDQYQYFIRILEVTKVPTNTAEDREILATNALEEISGQEIDTCSNQLASRVIEELLAYAPDRNLISLCNVFGSQFRLVFTDPYCSHVLQKLVVILAQRILNITSDKNEEAISKLKECFVRIAMFAVNNVEDFIFDPYANHILRTLFACVNGRAVKEDIGDTEAVKNIPQEFEDLAVTFTKRVVAWPQFNDLTSQVLPSGCIQALLLAVRDNYKLTKQITEKVLELCDSQSNFNLTEEKNKTLLHLLEASIVAAPVKLFKKLYEKLFKTKLKTLALTKSSNFLVQKLILHCHTREMFEDMFSELSESFEAILSTGFSGILLAMAKSCRRLKTKEGEFSKNIFECLHCNEPPERRNSTLMLLCCLTPFERYNQETSQVQLNGSLIIQEMLAFTKPIRLVTSLLSLDDNSLLHLLNDRIGCHITDAFCSSTFVGEKNREKLYKKLQRKYASLASSKYGSRSFDAIWSTLSKQQKTVVIEELKVNQSSLVSTPVGRIIALKVRLDLYRQDKEEWLKSVPVSDRKNSNKKKDNK